jgi:pyruvate formate lyase activating enzyme
MLRGTIFDIKKYAIHDGPGIRTTIFFKGCPLRCWWCHNSEGLELAPEIIFKENRCIKECKDCIEVCTRGALSRVNNEIVINREKCNLCGDCTQVCSSEALELIGREVTIEEVMKEVEKEMIFYDESGGGVTFSGGEPLMQPEFLDAILKECKEKNIHTALDTSGYASPEVMDKISDKVDIFLYDLKIMDDEKHKKYTGVSNKLILENLKKLAAQGNQIFIRIPLIPGINDGMDNINKMAKFIHSLEIIKEIDLLPYHKAGKGKYKRLDKIDKMNDTQSPSDERIKKIMKSLAHAGFSVKIGG